MYDMHILKEIAKNRLANYKFMRKISSLVNNKTGINGNPELVSELVSKYNAISPVKGKAILELGPGHTYQVMEEALARGASKAAIIDITKLIDDSVIEKTGIDYKIYSGGVMPYPDASFDIVWSHTVYEHLRFPSTTVKETFRVLKPGGIAVHHVDMRDHLILDEENENTFNMLQYKEPLWNSMSWNRSIYVNRLRVSDWIKVHEEAGFAVTVHETFISEAVRRAYQNQRLPYLNRYSETDAVTSQVLLSAVKPTHS